MLFKGDRIAVLTFERYLNGLGTKPLITKMSMKEVWLGTYTTVCMGNKDKERKRGRMRREG